MAIVNSYVSLPEGTGFPNSMLHSKDQVPPLKQLTHRASAFQTLSGLKKETRHFEVPPPHEWAKTLQKKHLVNISNGDGSKPWYLVNPKIAGKWMFIPLKMYL